MQSYFFVKYNRFTTLEHLKKFIGTGSVICFDFEDSIQDSQKKNELRSNFTRILNELLPQPNDFKIGLRINSSLPNLFKDLETIKGQKLHSLLIPKVEESQDIQAIKQQLDSNNTRYEEIIPIIESKTGLNHLESITNQLPSKVKKIGFGHCDYNLSINRFPLFHQDSKQYWKWVNEFAKILLPKNVSFVNSAFLDLNNHTFFKKILLQIHEIFGNNCGQFTLTTNQAIIAENFIPRKPTINFNNLLKDHLDLSVPRKYAEELISNFECDNKNKSFTVKKEPKLCEDLNHFMKSRLKNEGIRYIDCLMRTSKNGEPFFNKNGIHANEYFHDFVANELFCELNKIIQKQPQVQ